MKQILAILSILFSTTLISQEIIEFRGSDRTGYYPETGETYWDEEWFNKGSVIYADEMLYLYEEKGGNVALVEPSAEKLKKVSTFKVDEGAGPHWAHPAIFDGKLFIRHGDVLMIFNIKA